MGLAGMQDYLRPISTATGLLTSIVLLGVGVDMAYNHRWAAIATLGSFVVVCALEVTSVPEACFHARLSWSSPAPLPWSLLATLRDGTRAILYSLLALLVLMTSQHRMWLTAMAGALLFICAAEQVLLAYLEWRGSRRRDRTCLLEGDDFEERNSESPDPTRDATAGIVRQTQPEQI
ncbi:uncharacterized protein LOC122372836 [Amphibalanus amphitrite]|uniref:uncharacterized protein LOC122372836 n=1 Tax=Amphibalanus amphitrite TaxID=1232801 RepID=UPI001C91BE9E|nr:uncharacterized protein LOC122372836 [Amphibalanus amphitrite]